MVAQLARVACAKTDVKIQTYRRGCCFSALSFLQEGVKALAGTVALKGYSIKSIARFQLSAFVALFKPPHALF